METQAVTIETFIPPLSGLADLVRAIVEPVLLDQGCELVDLKTSGGHSQPLIQLFVDQGDAAGISLEQLESLNRFVGDVLDVEDGEKGLFSGRYTLELSSPGVERPLTKKSHFLNVEGQVIKVRILDAGQRATYQGELLQVMDDGIKLRERQGGDAEDARFISWLTVQKANLVFSFESTSSKKSGQKNIKKNNVGKAASRAGGTPKKAQKSRQDI
jgi:ribosome maturation factor RimP